MPQTQGEMEKMRAAAGLPASVNLQLGATHPLAFDPDSVPAFASRQEATTATQLVGARRALSPRPFVLVVESSPHASLLARTLIRECQVQRVPHGAPILEILDQVAHKPELILLDATTFSREALETCRQLKTNETTQSIPVILLVQRDDAAIELCALNLGVEDCIACPFRADVAEARIRNQIRNRIRNALLEREANQDSLTEVANRRCFDLALDAEWRRAMRYGHPLSLVMVDVDDFKQFNDLHGHREGDHCLRRVVKAMSQALTRPGDLLARYGGEEFAAILPGADLQGAHWIGELLREAVMALRIPQRRADRARPVTISVGCASVCPTANLTCYSLLQTADEQLYLAKHSGRNCVR